MTAKPKIVFAFVEAGLGHIMPMRAVCDAFEQKYGDRAQVVRTNFFKDTGDPGMKFVEDELVKEVKLHNRRKGRGFWQFVLMDMFGTEYTLRYLMEKRYVRGLEPSFEYIRNLNADMIFNTHFATLYYACEAKSRGWIDSDITAYCPDPVIGNQWDKRVELIGVSSAPGKEKAVRDRFKRHQVTEIPFLIRQQVKEFGGDKNFYRRQLSLPEDRFTILLADGAYGAGKLKRTVRRLLKSSEKLTVVAVCGKNAELHRELSSIKAPENIHFVPLGFTDKMLMLSACCDLFMGKAGASNLAEPIYFGVPAIVTFCATPVEKWICSHYTDYVGCAVKITNVRRAVALAERWAKNPAEMQGYRDACASQRRADGAELLADILWQRLVERQAARAGQSFETPERAAEDADGVVSCERRIA